MHLVEGGQSKRIVYDQSYFDMPADSVARQLPQGAGFAGFRIQEARDGALDWRKNDWVAFPRRRLFSLHRRIAPIWHVRARRRARRRSRRPAGRIPRFHQLLHRLEKRRGQCPDLRPDGGALDHRGFPLLDAARQGRRDGHRVDAVHPRAGFAFRRRAAAPRCTGSPRPRSRRRSTGSPRCTIPTACRCGRARASGSGARSTIPRALWCRRLPTRIRAASASANATASSTITSTASSTTAARPCGSSRCRARKGRAGGRDRSSFARSRPTTRSTTTSWRCGCPRSRFRPAPNSTCNYRLHWLADEPYSHQARPVRRDAS